MLQVLGLLKKEGNIGMSAWLTGPEMWFKFSMPYCFQKLEVPKLRHVWLPLNRNYKPLGHQGHERVRYEDYLAQAVRFRTDPQGFSKIWWDTTADSERLWLYDDGAKSRDSYFERLGRLMARSKVIDRQQAAEISRVPHLRAV